MKNRKKKIDWKNETAKSKRKIADMIVSGKAKIAVKKYSSEQLLNARQNLGYIRLAMRILQA